MSFLHYACVLLPLASGKAWQPWTRVLFETALYFQHPYDDYYIFSSVRTAVAVRNKSRNRLSRDLEYAHMYVTSPLTTCAIMNSTWLRKWLWTKSVNSRRKLNDQISAKAKIHYVVPRQIDHFLHLISRIFRNLIYVKLEDVLSHRFLCFEFI